MHRKRSLDEQHDLLIFDGPTVVLKGHPTRGIPVDSDIRVSTIEGQIIKEDVATKEFSLTVDPGRYIYVVRKHYVGTKRGFRYVGEFLVGLTEAQWAAMEFMDPQFSRVRQTTRGPRWTCTALACGHASISKISAMEHEAEHKGLSFLQAVDAKMVEQQLVEAAPGIPREPVKAEPKTANPPAGTGRPPTGPKMGKAGDWSTNVPGVPGG